MRYLALILLATPAVALAQFKCVQPGGAVSFQQAPCGAGAKSAKLELPPPPPDDGRAEYRNAAAQGKVLIGASLIDMWAAWGQPERCNNSLNGRRLYQQCLYAEAYVYLDEGIVTAIQSR